MIILISTKNIVLNISLIILTKFLSKMKTIDNLIFFLFGLFLHKYINTQT